MKRLLLLLYLSLLLGSAPGLRAGDAYEPNNAPERATALTPGKALQVSIDPVKDVDFFVVDVPKPGVGYLDVTLRNIPAEIAPYIQVFGDQGEVGKVQRPAGTPLFLRIASTAAGKYYIMLRDGQGDWQDEMDDKASAQLMSLRADFTPVSQDFEPNNSVKEAAALDLGKTVQAAIFPAKDQDFFKVAIPGPGRGLVTLKVTDVPENINLGIWVVDAEGKGVANQWQQQVSTDVTLAHIPAGPGDLVFMVGTRDPAGASYYSSRRDASSLPYMLRVDCEPAGDPFEPNDELKSAAELPFGEAKAARIFPAGDNDFYKVEVPKPGRGRLDVVVRSVPHSVRPLLHLYDPAGKEIDKLGRGQGAQIRFQRELSTPGTYVLHVQDGGLSEQGHFDRADDDYSRQPYSILATFTPVADAGEPNDSHDTAKAIEVGKPLEATLFPVGDTDFYKFTLPAAARGLLRIQATKVSEGIADDSLGYFGFNDKMHPALRLFDTAKKEIQLARSYRGQPFALTRPLAAGGDFFLQVQDGDLQNGRYWENWNDSSSTEPYSLLVAFDPAPESAAEPNDSLETAEALPLGEARKATLFPGGDSDFYKVEIAADQVGPLRIEAGDFHDLIHPRLVLFGPDKKPILSVRRYSPRLILNATTAAPGTYTIQLHATDLNKGRWFGPPEQFDLVPYTIRVTRPPALGAPTEREPDNDLQAAQPLQPGQPVVARIDKPGDIDWFKIAVEKPSVLDIALPDVPPEIDPQFSVRSYPPDAALAQARNVLYLHGPRNDFNLDQHFADIRFTRLEHNTAEGKAAFANVDIMKRYDAIVVECLHDPAHLDLLSPRVQENITRYVQGGGRFIFLTPFCAVKLFDVEVAEPGKWHDDLAVDVYAKHPLLDGIVRGTVRGWDTPESIGYFTGWKQAGFQMLTGHASDPEQNAVTIAKQVGTGYLIFDTQTVGNGRNWPEADWKLRAWLGVPQETPLGLFNDTLRTEQQGGNGQPEFVRILAWKPGTYYVAVNDTDGRRASDKPYSIVATATPISAPPPAEESLFTARRVAISPEGKEGETSFALPAEGGRLWLRLDGRADSEVTVALSDVPCNVDPQVTVYESLAPRPEALPKPKRVLYLHGERGDFNLDRGAVDVQFDRIEWNSERALGVLLKLENFSAYDAVVVDAITRPGEFGLDRETVAKNVEAYAQQGGRFIVLSPLCQVKLFGVENTLLEWHTDNVREHYPVHPLAASRTPDQDVNKWPGAESFGVWAHTPADGFQVVFADWRNPQRLAVTLARQVGKGLIVLDAQPAGNNANLGAAAWKLYRYLGAEPLVRSAATYDGTQGGALGMGETFRLSTKAVPYFLEVANRAASASQSPMRLRAAFTTPERPLEPDDAPDLAKPAPAGEEIQANFYPNGDEDWRAVSVPGRGILTLDVTGVPDNIDPTVHLRRKTAVEKPLRVLYLEAYPPGDIDVRRFEGVAVTRIDADQPKAAAALDGLANFDMVLLSTLSDARQFGLNTKEAHAKLRAFVEAGGRCLFVRPYGVSFAENCPQMGGILESFSSQWDAGGWHAAHATDGYKVPGQQGTGWCCGNGAKPPHTFVWSFGGETRRLDRLVLYNTTSSNGARVKELEVSIGDDGKTFRSVGKFTAEDSDERQVFRFEPVGCKFVQLAIASNYGHQTETQFGEAEFYGPDSIDGFFGANLEGGWPRGSTVAVDPLHWIARRREAGQVTGWPDHENAGWWTGWEAQGFQMVYADRSNTDHHAVTLVKEIGKGWVVLDSQWLTRREYADKAEWKLHNYFDAARAIAGDFDNTQNRKDGGDESVDLVQTEKADYLVRLADSEATGNYSNQSPRRYAFAAGFRPEESDYEPNDTPARAVRIVSDDAIQENLFPSGDEDWFRFAVETPSAVRVLVDEVPSAIDLVVSVHRADPAGKPVKVLYLSCRLEADIDRREWGPAPVAFTRIDAGTPGEATAMEKLAGYDVVVLDGLNDLRRFGMDRKETWDRIQSYAEGGGRFVLLAPLGYSYSLLATEAGATVEAWSSGDREQTRRLCDGAWEPGTNNGGWSSGYRAKPPHWFVWRLGEGGAGTQPTLGGRSPQPPTVSRLVVYNTAYNKGRCAKEIEFQVADSPSPDAFKSVGKFECKQVDERQEFTFQPVAARYVKVLMLSNYGDQYYTDVGEVELYGQNQPESFYGLRHTRGRRTDAPEIVKPDHWILSRRVRFEPNKWRGVTSSGYFTGWAQSGFEPVLADRADPKAFAITLCKAVGKGFIVLDAQDLGAPGRDEAALWKLQNYFDLEPTHIGTFNNTQNVQKGGREQFEFFAEPGLYTLRVTDAEGWRSSLEKYLLLVNALPVSRPFEGGDTPAAAATLASGQPVRTTIYPKGDVDWFRVKLAKASPLCFELLDVSEELDPTVDVYAAGKLDKPVRSFNRTQQGNEGYPEMFLFTPEAPGEFFIKVAATEYYGGMASRKPFTVRATFDEATEATPPRIYAAWPGDGVRDVSTRPRIVLSFDRPMSAASITAASFVVRGEKSGTMDGKIAYDPTTYQATFESAKDFQAGEAVTVLARTGLTGASGGALAEERSWTFTTQRIDVGDGKEATVRIALSPASPIGAGEATVTVTPSRRLRAAPTLSARTKGGAVLPVGAVQKTPRGQWVASITVPAGTASGPATFQVQGIDVRGVAVTQITEGQAFAIDTDPPAAMPGLTAEPAPEGKARLAWKRLAGEPDLGGYRLYRSEQEGAAAATLVKSVVGADFLTWDDPTPKDGTWFYSVAAADRAGNVGKPSPTARVVTDRVPPKQAIAGVTAKVAEKPRIDLAWKATDEAEAVGYSVFRFTKGEERPPLLTAKPLTEVPKDRLTLQDFPKDEAYVYIVAARDQAGNLGPPSEPAEVVLDTKIADARIALPEKMPLTQGDHKIAVALSEPLAGDLELSLRMPDDSVRKVAVTKKDDLNYEATLSFAVEDPEGWVHVQTNGEDRYGNKGVRIVQGGSFTIDTGPPKSWVYTKPEGRLGTGKIEVTVDFGEDVKDDAKLFYQAGEKKVEVAIKRQRGRRFTGELSLPADTPNGPAQFLTVATDSFDHTGGVVVRGKDFTIDTVAPDAPINVAVRPGPGKSLVVSWSPPTREPVASFRLYGAPDANVKPAAETLLADNVREAKASHTPKTEQILWFVVTAIDLAGNESPPSKVVKGVPDTQAPPPATDLQVALENDGRLRLTWQAPAADEPVQFHVYRLAQPAASLAGQKPVQQTKEPFVIDDPKTQGILHYYVTVADEAGNESPPVAAKPFDYDVGPPTVTVVLTPTEGQRGYSESYYVHYTIGVLAAGEKAVALIPSEKLAQPPTLRYRTRSMDTPREIPLTEAEGKWQGKLTIPEKTEDGLLTFFFQGIDLKANRGDVIPGGKGNVFWIDTTPPEAVATLKATSRPLGKVELAWSPPPGDRSQEVKYAVYRSAEAFKQIGELKPVAADLQKETFTDEPQKDGTYHYAVVAIDQAGNVGKLVESTSALSDGTPPPAPTELKATVKGEILLSWQAPDDEPLTYRITRGGKPMADGVPNKAFADAPEANGTYEYRVVAVDAAGNESKESEPVKIDFVDTLPSATIATEPASPVRSTFRVNVTASQPLKEAPELFLNFANGAAVRVPAEKRDEAGKAWVGSVEVTKDTPNGEARFTFLGVAPDGSKGSRIRSGEAAVIDTRPPSASIALSPRSPLRRGKVAIVLRPNEPLKETPTLSVTTMGSKARPIELKKAEPAPGAKWDNYAGEIEITDQDQDGVAFFTWSGIDLAGNVGAELYDAQFVVDSHPPKAPSKLEAKAKRGGYLELAWLPPAYEANEVRDDIVGYNVYASQAEFADVKDLKPLGGRLVRIPSDVQPPADGKWFVAMTTVDAAGLESAPSNVASAVSDRTPPPPPTITKAQAIPEAIDLAWDADPDAVAFSVYVRVPGERDERLVAEGLKEKSYQYRPLRGGAYAIRVAAADAFGQGGYPSKPAMVNFEQKAPLASLTLPAESFGYGTFPVAVETTVPLVRAPKLRLVPQDSPAIDVPLTGAGKDWRGQFQIDKDVKGASARFEYEGVSVVDGREVTGRGILSAEKVALDFEKPTAAVEFDQSVPRRDRKVLLRAGRHAFDLRASEPLKGDPKLTFTPRGKPAQSLALAKKSDTLWGGVLVIDKEVGDGSGIFEFQGVDLAGNATEELTANRNVGIDTTPPTQITKIRAVPLPGGKVRVDWIPPYFEGGNLDTEANTFYLYRSESEIKDVTGVAPHQTIERILGILDTPPADRDYFYAVAALDDAGNMGPISASASVHVDKKAPNPPRDLRVNQTETGVAHLTWLEPDGEKPLFYNVYLSDHPILTTKGMTPRNPGITWTEIYGSPNENGKYYFAVTAVDPALNESEPGNSVLLDYKGIAPIAKFLLEPDIWLHNGDYSVTLRTSKDLVEPPKVEINSESGKRYPITFDGSGSLWKATLHVDDTYPEGTYGFVYRGKDAEGNVGSEIQRGPLFHVDKKPTLPPGELKIEPDTQGTPGAVVLHWVTPKKDKEQTEVPHFYNIYRSTKTIETIKGMAPVHTLKVEFENLDDYHHTDMPPENGTYFYVVTSLDLARNESPPSNVFKVTVQNDSPRATLELFSLADGKASPAATDAEGTPVLGKGKVRVVVKTTSPLGAAPKIAWHLKREEEKTNPIAMTGEGASWQGDFAIEADYEEAKTAFLTYEGVSVGGTKGAFIRKGAAFRIDTQGPVAEIIIPSAYKMKVNVKTNKLEEPPVRGGLIEVKLTGDKELGAPPRLTYTLDGGQPVPVPMAGFGRDWTGYLDIPFSPKPQDGKFQYEGVDRSGNVSTTIAKRRYPYDVNDDFPPRKIANYATTGGTFVTDTVPPEIPDNVETEMRKLGVAVVKWKEPAGAPATYNLYRSLTPITNTAGLKPIKTDIFATLMVDDPPVDGNYFYAVTAVDLAGNESGLSAYKSVFIDTIKPELKITAVPSGNDFVILMDEDSPPELSLTIKFPGRESVNVELGGSSGELKKYEVRRMPNGQRGIVLPQMAEFFNGRVEVIVHSPDPDGNIVEEKTEVEMKQIAASTGGEVSSTDEQVQLVIPPGLSPVIPKGPKEVKRVEGYQHLYFVQYANIPSEKPKIEEGEKRGRDQVDPLPPGLEVVGRPYVIQMNLPPEEPLELKGSATQADLSQLKPLMAKLKMKVPTLGSEAVEDPDYLKTRLKVIKWVPARSDDDVPHWEYVPDVEVDVKNKELIVPASEITTYVIVSERTPPSIRDLKPERGGAVASFRPEISCLIVDKGTGVAIGAENRIVLSIDGKKVTLVPGKDISAGDPTEVRVTYTPDQDLTPGVHTIGIRAEDVVENVANVKWQFTVDNKPPEILSVSPASDARLPVARPIIQARVRDEGGIDPKRTELSIDGNSLPSVPRPTGGQSAAYDEATGLLTCATRDDLSSGAHEAALVVTDKAGMKTEKKWTFQIDLEPPAVASILPAPDSAVAPDTAKIALRLKDLSGRAEVLDLRIDDARIPSAAQDKEKGFAFDEEKGELAYTAAKPFPAGEHRVAVLFADDLGNSATRTWAFTSKEGAAAAAALDFAVRTPKFAAARNAYTSVAARVDDQRIEQAAPEAMPAITQLVEEAESLAVEAKYEESTAKYVEAAQKLETAEKTAAEFVPPKVSAELEAAKTSYSELLAKVDKPAIEKLAPEALPEVDSLIKEAEALAAERKLEESAAKYAAAAEKLATAQKKAEEATQAQTLAARKAKYEAARTAYGELVAKVDKGRIEKHVPDALPEIDKLVGEAQTFAADQKLDDGAANYLAATDKLAAADKAAAERELAAAVGEVQAKYEAARKGYADLTARVDKARIQKYVPEVLPVLTGLVQQAEALAGEKKIAESAARYAEAAEKLAAADATAAERARAEVVGAAAARFEAAKKSYSDLAARLDGARIQKHAPDALTAVNALAGEAEALGAERKFEEGAAKYVEAAQKLAATDKLAEGFEQAQTATLMARYEGARKQYDELAARVDGARIRKHVPDALPEVSQLALAAVTLAGERKYAESAAKYAEAAQKLAAADTTAEQLARQAVNQAAATYEAARQRYADVAGRVNGARIQQHLPDALVEVAGLVREVQSLAEQNKLVEAAAKLNEATDKLAVVDQKAEALELAAKPALPGALAQCRVATEVGGEITEPASFAGLKVGVAKRADVNAALGRPQFVNRDPAGGLIESYAGGNLGLHDLVVRYLADDVVDQVELRFEKPLARDAVAAALKLAGTGEPRTVGDLTVERFDSQCVELSAQPAGIASVRLFARAPKVVTPPPPPEPPLPPVPPGPVVEVRRVWSKADETVSGFKGMMVYGDVVVNGYKDQQAAFTVRLRRTTGPAIMAVRGTPAHFADSRGRFAATSGDTARYDRASWSPYRLFVPYSLLDLPRGQDHQLIIGFTVTVGGKAHTREAVCTLRIP